MIIKNYKIRLDLSFLSSKIYLIFFAMTIISCASPSFCECEDISRQAIIGSLGFPSNVDLDDLKDCAKKVRNDLDLKMPANQISIENIQQVSYEMCKFGYFEGKGSDEKKYYPNSEK